MIKKRVCIILLSIACSCLYSQDPDTLNLDKSRWSLGMNVYLSASKMALYKLGSSNATYTKLVRKSENSKFSYSLNVFAEYSISTRAKLDLGVGYKRYGSRNLANVTSHSNGPDVPSEAYFISVSESIEIPLNVKYYLSDKIHTITGFSPVVNIESDRLLVFKFDDGHLERNSIEDNLNEFEGLNFFINLGMGMDILKKNGFDQYIQLYWQHALHAFSKTEVYQRTPYSIGLILGFRLK